MSAAALTGAGCQSPEAILLLFVRSNVFESGNCCRNGRAGRMSSLCDFATEFEVWWVRTDEERGCSPFINLLQGSTNIRDLPRSVWDDGMVR